MTLFPFADEWHSGGGMVKVNKKKQYSAASSRIPELQDAVKATYMHLTAPLYAISSFWL